MRIDCQRGVLFLMVLTSVRVAGAAPNYPTPLVGGVRWATAAAVGDYDGNGHPDVAVATEEVSVLLGRGDGTFVTAPAVRLSNNPQALAAIDLDADGRDDLVVGMGSDVLVLHSRGGGAFDAPVSYGVGFLPLSLAVGDLDADGRRDLVTANVHSADVSVLLGDGRGGFLPERRFSACSYPYSVAIADVDADGLPDLAVGCRGGQRAVALLPALGDGAFGQASLIDVGDDPMGVVGADLDADGDDDLAVALEREGAALVLTSAGDGSFSRTRTATVGTLLSAIAAADLDGDGVVDLIVADRNSSSLVLFASGRAGAPVRFRAGVDPYTISIADFDGDGIDDLASVAHRSNGVALLRGVGGGEFGPQARADVSGLPGGPLTGDIDGDGRDDLVVTQPGGFSVLLGRGGGRFAPPIPVAGPAYPFGTLVADLDADGHLDLAAADFLTHDVQILYGTGNGTFSAPTHLDAGEIVDDLAAADFDRDGLPDLAMTLPDLDQVAIARGRGRGVFGPLEAMPAGFATWSLAAADVDGDGWTDLVTTSQAGDTLGVLLARGDGSFAPTSLIDAGHHPSAPTIADVDGDGWLDVVLTVTLEWPPFSHGVAFFASRGGGRFAPPLVLPGSWALGPVVVRDVDADGRVDLIVPSGLGEVEVFPGGGDGTFGTLVRFVAPEGTAEVAAGDFDDNGLVDLAVIDWDIGGVGLLMNQAVPPEASLLADAGLDQVLECSTAAGAPAHLEGASRPAGLVEPGADPHARSFAWFEDYGGPLQRLLGTSASLDVVLALGSHSLTLRVRDSLGGTSLDEVRVEVADTRPPRLSVAVTPAVLWPPNGRAVDVAAIVTAADACGKAGVVLEAIEVVESGAAVSRPPSAADIDGAEFGTADFDFALRAARAPGSERRTYVIRYRATDASGHGATSEATVAVRRPAAF